MTDNKTEITDERLNKLLEQVSGLEREKNNIVEISERQKTEIIELKRQIEEFENYARTKDDDETKLLKTEIVELKSQIEAFENNAKTKENDEIERLKSQIKELHTTNDKQSFELDSKVEEIYQLRYKMKQMEESSSDQKFKDLNKRVKEQADIIRVKDHEIDKLNISINEQKLNDNGTTQLQSRIHNLEKELIEKESETKSLREQIKELNLKHRELQEQLNYSLNRDPDKSKTSATTTKTTPTLPERKIGVNMNKRSFNPLLAGATITRANIDVNQGLTDLLESDIVIENVYERMKTVGMAKVKMLAMQLGVNFDHCKNAIDKLIQIQVLRYDSEDTVVFVG